MNDLGNSDEASVNTAQTAGNGSIQPVVNTGSTADLAAGKQGETDLSGSRFDRTTRGGLEQARRNFKAAHPELYRYIMNRECEKILDAMGDLLSGQVLVRWPEDYGQAGHAAANLMWQRAAEFKRAWHRQLEAGD